MSPFLSKSKALKSVPEIILFWYKLKDVSNIKTIPHYKEKSGNLAHNKNKFYTQSSE